MMTLICIGITIIVCLIFGYATGAFNSDSDNQAAGLRLTIVAAVIGLLVSFTQPYSLTRISQGNIGLKVNWSGNDRGISNYEYETGWVFYNWYNQVIYEFPGWQQHVQYPKQEVITKGGFRTTIKPSFNYKLISGSVGDMFQELRVEIQQIEQGWLMNAIVGSVNDVANRWTVDDIFNKREEFETAIVAEVNKRVKKWFIMSQLRTNIEPPLALQKSINAKTRAIQDVQVANNQKLVAEAQAQQKIAVARGDSAQAVIRAAGEAEAIHLKQIILTPLYVEYMKTQKWNGVNPSTVLGGQGIMVNVK